jgi:transcriptional regulator with XRE-family HTH domain
VETQGAAVETNPAQVFGSVLRTLREQAGMPQRELAQRVYCSPSLISAIELGAKPAKLDLVERIDAELNAAGVLLKVWPITAAGGYASWFAYVAELEKEACKIHEWELRTVPGLLQTADYARALMRAVRPRDSDEKIDGDVSARMNRQEIFARDDPPMAWFVLDESILHRPIGGSYVMRGQLIKLEKMAEETNIVVQVMPFNGTMHPGAEGPLRILEFLDSRPVWYTEGWYSGRMAETPAEVSSAMTCFDLIRASALPPGESLQMIAQVRFSKYEKETLDKVVLFRRQRRQLRGGCRPRRPRPGARHHEPLRGAAAVRSRRVAPVHRPGEG